MSTDRIYLTGFMATGKSTLGILLAQQLGWGFVDLDDFIEARTGQTVAGLIELGGEEHFRRVESEALQRVSRLREVVVATGGGTPIMPDNRCLLLGTGRVIHLELSPEEIVQRVSRGRADNGPRRPLLDVPDPVNEAKTLLAARKEAYTELCGDATTIVVNTGSHNRQQAVGIVLERLGHSGLAPNKAIQGNAPATAHVREVPVRLGKRSYRVAVGLGLLDRAGELLPEVFGNGPSRTVTIVSDPVVWSLYGTRLASSLDRAGFESGVHLVPEGEETKSLAELEAGYHFLTRHGRGRADPVIALGGGVVGDLAGLLAATYQRGVPLVQIPTTLLAQVDSSVGGKVAVNLPAGKNLVGAFYQPSLVLSDTSVLRTLPDEDFRQGLAEAVKMAVIEGGAFWKLVEGCASAIRARRPAELGELVRMAVEAKAAVVAADERERGLRRVLNLGHTMGHALEAVAGYGRLGHGDAVALGMVAAASYALRRGLPVDPRFVSRLRALLRSYGLPTTLGLVGLERPTTATLASYLLADKKASKHTLTVVVPRQPGDVGTIGGVAPADFANTVEVLKHDKATGTGGESQ